MFIRIKNAARAATFGSCLVLGACAEYPDRIAPVYIPSIVYKGASCSEINEERGRLAGYVENLAVTQGRVAENDTGAVIVGFVVFWPALAALPFTVDQSAQLAVARGHYNALIEAGRKQGCSGETKAGTYRYPNGKLFPGDLQPM